MKAKTTIVGLMLLGLSMSGCPFITTTGIIAAGKAHQNSHKCADMDADIKRGFGNPEQFQADCAEYIAEQNGKRPDVAGQLNH